jgi:flagellar hook-length control protein FliK
MRPALGSDGAPDLPFESLLDTDTQADPPPQATQSTQPRQAPQRGPDRTADDSTGNSNAKADGKAPDKTADKPDSKTAGKTAGKADDKTTGKPATPNQPVVRDLPLDPNDNQVANTTGDTTVTKAQASSKTPQISQQPVGQQAAPTPDDAKTPDLIDAVAAVAAPVAPNTTGDTKVKTDVKLGETAKDTNTAKNSDDAKNASTNVSGDAKLATVPIPVAAATGQTIAPVQTPAPAAVAPAAPTAAVTSATTNISQATPLAKETAPVGAKTTAAPKAKISEFAALQDGAEKLAAHPHDEAPPTVQHEASDKPTPIATNAQIALPKTTGDVVLQSSPPSPEVTQVVAPPPPLTPASPAPPAAQTPPVPIAGVAIEIATQAQAGKNHFEIRLDPPELGRIEVRLDVDSDGHVTSRLIADRSDTLNLLRNDASGLQRALQDAGLKTSDNGLQFSLRDQGMGRQQNPVPATPNATQIVVQDSMLPAGDIAQRNYSRLAGLRGGVDIRV